MRMIYQKRDFYDRIFHNNCVNCSPLGRDLLSYVIYPPRDNCWHSKRGKMLKSFAVYFLMCYQLQNGKIFVCEISRTRLIFQMKETILQTLYIWLNNQIVNIWILRKQEHIKFVFYISPENISKQEILQCFQRAKKETSGIKCVNVSESSANAIFVRETGVSTTQITSEMFERMTKRLEYY